MVRSLLSADHRFWFNLLCIYMSVVRGDSFFFIPMMQDYEWCWSVFFFRCHSESYSSLVVRGPNLSLRIAEAPLMYVKAPRISAP
jgi:hypothetical protein